MIARVLARLSRLLAGERSRAVASNIEGNELRQAGRIADALDKLDEAVRLAPSYGDALTNRAHALAELGRVNEAIDGYRDALAAAPGYIHAQLPLAGLLRRTKRFAEATAAYEKLLRGMREFRVQHLSADAAWMAATLPGEYLQLLLLFHVTKLCAESRFDAARLLLTRFLVAHPFDGWTGMVLLSWLLRVTGDSASSVLAAQGVVEFSEEEVAALLPSCASISVNASVDTVLREPWLPTVMGYERRQPVVAALRHGQLLYSTHGVAILDREDRFVRDLSRGLHFPLAALIGTIPARRVPGRVLALLNPWSDAFFHWMYESIPKLGAALLDRSAGEVFDRVLLRAVHPFHLEMLAAFGIREGQVLDASKIGPRVQSDELIVVTGFEAQPPENYVDPWCFGLLREKYLKADGTERGRRIFVDRRSGNQRRILNGDAVLECVRAHGFETVYPEDLSIAAQARLFNSCSAILAPAGAALGNLVYCSRGAQVSILYPEGTPWKTYEQFCAYTGAHHTRLDVDVEKRNEEYLTDWIIPTNANLQVDTDALEAHLRSIG